MPTSSSDDDLPDVPLSERIAASSIRSFSKANNGKHPEKRPLEISSSEDEEPPLRTISKPQIDCGRKRKKEEMLEKKLEKEKKAAGKKLEAQRIKALKPGESPKTIVVDIDSSLLETDFGGLLLQEIQQLGAKSQIETHPPGLNDTIFFWRTELTEDDSESRQFERFCVVYLKAKDYVSMVANSVNRNAGVSSVDTGVTLTEFSKAKKTLIKGMNLTFVVMGVEKHFRNVKTQQQRDYRQRVRGMERTPAKIWSDVTRFDVEESKIELQLFQNVHVIQVETKEEMAAAVGRFVKSVAERPHKMSMRSQTGNLFSFCADDNVACVKPNSLGEGLIKAWKTQLSQFTLVSDDVAATIVSAYPSPQRLRAAFRDSPAPHLLLKDLVIRRGVGPLEGHRKVGAELSKRIHTFFTSVDGDLMLSLS